MPPLVAIPNVSEGRDARLVGQLLQRVVNAGGAVLDVHSDAMHNRSVITLTAPAGAALAAAITELADAARQIDLRQQRGVHPRLGALDVCPFVPHDADMGHAIAIARLAGESIAGRTGLPVYLYGAAAIRTATRDLPDIRRGGLEALVLRARLELPPDFGPRTIDLRRGVVCVGAREPLIAFNIWITGTAAVARRIAATVREAAGGRRGLRALGLEAAEEGLSQISMNLVSPEDTGIDDAFAAVAEACVRAGTNPVATEVVGLVPDRYLPDPNGRAARLLRTPGRSLESALQEYAPD